MRRVGAVRCEGRIVIDAYRLVHTIKGTAANLGMEEVAAAAGALEAALAPLGQRARPREHAAGPDRLLRLPA